MPKYASADASSPLLVVPLPLSDQLLEDGSRVEDDAEETTDAEFGAEETDDDEDDDEDTDEEVADDEFDVGELALAVRTLHESTV